MTEISKQKTSRKLETREIKTRKRGWVPPSNLEAPDPPEGFHHRWVRFEFRGTQDEKNVTSRLRSGYEPVRADEYPDRLDLPAMTDGKYKGIIAVGGLMLMRCPIEVKEDRDAYFRGITNDQKKISGIRSYEGRAPLHANFARKAVSGRIWWKQKILMVKIYVSTNIV
jgi:hypothetical protein